MSIKKLSNSPEERTFCESEPGPGRRDAGIVPYLGTTPASEVYLATVHLAVEDRAGLFYNQRCNYCVFKEKFGGRGSGKVKAMVR